MLKEKRGVLIKFILFYLVSILFIVIAFITYGKASNRTDSNKDLLMINESLSNYLNELNNLNEEYLKMLQFPLNTSKRESILNKQTDLRGQINVKLDSLRRVGEMMDTKTQASYNTVVSSFEVGFKNWENVNHLILSMKGVKASTIPNAANELRLKDDQIALLESKLEVEQAVKRLLTETSSKDDRIALLESRLKAAQAVKRPVAESSLKDQEQIKFLKWAVRSQVETIKNLENRLKKSD